LITVTLIGPIEAVDVISALVVSPSNFQLVPVNGLGPEFPEWLLFLQATVKRRQMAIAKKGDRFDIAIVFVRITNFYPI
jgi:hypothetical protein